VAISFARRLASLQCRLPLSARVIVYNDEPVEVKKARSISDRPLTSRSPK